MKRMLINATQPEEVRIALVDGQSLYDLDVETPNQQKKKANIYKGRVTRIEPSLEAAFVDYGSERHGFLPFKELAKEYFPDQKPESGKFTIRDVLSEGQELIVQVQKEERGNKGAALTTQITLAGPYVVMMPNNPKAGGISRRIEGSERSDIRDTLGSLDLPDGMGLIIRTAGVGKSTEELQWGVNYLIQLWDAIKGASNDKQAPFLIHQESDIVILAIRDYLRQDIGEIIIDDMATYHKARDFIQHVMPQQVYKVKPYQDTVPLFTRFQIESQIESAYLREVTLPSGGAIVIDTTEALTAIDINSSRATKGSDIEETAFNTNMEAAVEIARQLRLRDLGGLVVIDFIDMHSNRHQREIENKLRESVKSDRARIQISKISRFGLLEMSRQRLRPSIEESTQIVCPRCKGVGVIRGVSSLGLSLLRLLEEESMKENTRRVTVQLPVDVATFLLNEKRSEITRIEDRHQLHIMIVPNESLHTPDYIIERTRHNDELSSSPSYEMKEAVVTESDNQAQPIAETIKEEPAIKNLQPTAPPQPKPEPKPGLFSRVWKALFGANDSQAEEPKEAETEKQPKKKQSENRRNPRGERNEEKGNNRRRNNRRRNNRRRPPENADGATIDSAKPQANEEQQANRNKKRGSETSMGSDVQLTETPMDFEPANNKKPAEKAARKENGKAVDEKTVDEKPTDSKPKAKERNDKPRNQRRRGRYSTRYNSRRRAPENAATMSINSPAPHIGPVKKDKPETADTKDESVTEVAVAAVAATTAAVASEPTANTVDSVVTDAQVTDAQAVEVSTQSEAPAVETTIETVTDNISDTETATTAEAGTESADSDERQLTIDMETETVTVEVSTQAEVAETQSEETQAETTAKSATESTSTAAENTGQTNPTMEMPLEAPVENTSTEEAAAKSTEATVEEVITVEKTVEAPVDTSSNTAEETVQTEAVISETVATEATTEANTETQVKEDSVAEQAVAETGKETAEPTIEQTVVEQTIEQTAPEVEQTSVTEEVIEPAATADTAEPADNKTDDNADTKTDDAKKE